MVLVEWEIKTSHLLMWTEGNSGVCSVNSEVQHNVSISATNPLLGSTLSPQPLHKAGPTGQPQQGLLLNESSPCVNATLSLILTSHGGILCSRAVRSKLNRSV